MTLWEKFLAIVTYKYPRAVMNRLAYHCPRNIRYLILVDSVVKYAKEHPTEIIREVPAMDVVEYFK